MSTPCTFNSMYQILVSELIFPSETPEELSILCIRFDYDEPRCILEPKPFNSMYQIPLEYREVFEPPLELSILCIRFSTPAWRGATAPRTFNSMYQIQAIGTRLPRRMAGFQFYVLDSPRKMCVHTLLYTFNSMYQIPAQLQACSSRCLGSFQFYVLDSAEEPG